MAERVDPSWQLWCDIYYLVNDDDEIAQEEIDCIMDQAEGYRFQMRCCGCEYILQERNESGLRKLMGWIGSFVTTSNASSVDISTVSMSSAEASSKERNCRNCYRNLRRARARASRRCWKPQSA